MPLHAVIDRRAEVAATGTVPKLWPGSTVVCLGGGPSLSLNDVLACYLKARVIAINDAYKLAHWADVIYGSDAKWWRYHAGCEGHTARKYCLEPVPEHPEIVTLRNTGRMGIETDPSGLRSCSNSGGAAINLAVHLGAARILLLGYDMKAPRAKGGSHWFGDHPPELFARSPYHLFIDRFASQVAPLEALGVEVINCSRDTALTVFPRRPLEEYV